MLSMHSLRVDHFHEMDIIQFLSLDFNMVTSFFFFQHCNLKKLGVSSICFFVSVLIYLMYSQLLSPELLSFSGAFLCSVCVYLN